MNIDDFYRPVQIANLDIIQSEVLKLIPSHLLDKNNLTYIKDNKKIFLGIPALYEFLESKQLQFSVGVIAVNVITGLGSSNYHIDSGPWQYSLNIPILNCKNTRINFFKVNSDYQIVKESSHYFFRYTKEQCELIYEVETVEPYLLGVKTPHRIVNNSNDTRVMLLIRLFPGINLDNL
jgi:hypothetical protein